ncbi:MAG: HAD family phosphatase [Planctomycetota bacterium]|nr:MAG: HAD family phosphatase [Planctomycetota bacterium]REK49239.1 MAG: HAD family phosphatase [Planctomycetota bacterium]
MRLTSADQTTAKGQNMTDVRAVIFDVDGVLIDSYNAHFESWQRLAAENGLTMSEAEFARDFGRTSREIIADLWPSAAESEARVAEMDDRKEALYREIIEADFPAMAGAVELIDALDAAGFLLGVGSSGPPENVALTLARLNRQDRFGSVVTGADVTAGKPNPEVFLTAAGRLGVSPACCAVIEDAAAGITAANAAGMQSIGLVSRGRRREALSAAHRIVDRLDELSAASIAELIG